MIADDNERATDGDSIHADAPAEPQYAADAPDAALAGDVATSAPDPVERLSFAEAVGAMLMLCWQAELYRDWTADDLEYHFVPPLQAGQCKIYFDADRNPVAFVTWALVNKEHHAVLLDTGHTPPPDAWSSGDELWFIDIVAPFGHAPSIVRDMKRNVFEGRTKDGYSLMRNPDHSIAKVRRWSGFRVAS